MIYRMTVERIAVNVRIRRWLPSRGWRGVLAVAACVAVAGCTGQGSASTPDSVAATPVATASPTVTAALASGPVRFWQDATGAWFVSVLASGQPLRMPGRPFSGDVAQAPQQPTGIDLKDSVSPDGRYVLSLGTDTGQTQIDIVDRFTRAIRPLHRQPAALAVRDITCAKFGPLPPLQNSEIVYYVGTNPSRGFTEPTVFSQLLGIGPTTAPAAEPYASLVHPADCFSFDAKGGLIVRART
jgi:hypothetical protein